MNKVVASPEQAIADITDGATIAIAGFSVAHGFANSLIVALRDERHEEPDARVQLARRFRRDARADPRGEQAGEEARARRSRCVRAAPTASEEQINTASSRSSSCRRGSSSSAAAPAARASPPSIRRRASAPTSSKAASTASSTGSNTCSSTRSISITPSAAAIAPIASATCSSAAATRTSIRASPRPRSARSSKSTRSSSRARSRRSSIDLPGIFVKRVVKTTQPKEGKLWKRPERRPADKPRLYNDKPALTRQGIAKNAAKLVTRRHLRQPRRRHPDDGLELLQGPRRDPARGERRPRLRPHADGRERDRCRHLQRRGAVRRADARRVVLRQRHVVRDGARRAHPHRHPRRVRSRRDRQRRELEHAGREARRHRRRDGPALGQGRSHHRHGAHRQQGPAEAAQEVHLSAHGPGLRELRRHRPRGAALGQGPLRRRRGGAGLHAAGSDRAHRDGHRRRRRT